MSEKLEDWLVGLGTFVVGTVLIVYLHKFLIVLLIVVGVVFIPWFLGWMIHEMRRELS